MFTPFVRFGLLLFIGICSVLFAYAGYTAFLILGSLLSIGLVWDYFRRGTIPLAMFRLGRGDIETAARIAGYTTKPDFLSRKQKANFFFLKGYVAREKDEMSVAADNLQLALHTGISSQHFKAMAILALCDSLLIQKRGKEAIQYFENITDLKVHPSLQPTIEQMSQFLSRIR